MKRKNLHMGSFIVLKRLYSTSVKYGPKESYIIGSAWLKHRIWYGWPWSAPILRMESSFGMSATALQWFGSYLEGRFQVISKKLFAEGEVNIVE